MWAGAPPETPLGEITELPDLLGGFKGPTSKGRKKKKEGGERGGYGPRCGRRVPSPFFPSSKIFRRQFSNCSTPSIHLHYTPMLVVKKEHG